MAPLDESIIVLICVLGIDGTGRCTAGGKGNLGAGFGRPVAQRVLQSEQPFDSAEDLVPVWLDDVRRGMNHHMQDSDCDGGTMRE